MVHLLKGETVRYKNFAGSHKIFVEKIVFVLLGWNLKTKMLQKTLLAATLRSHFILIFYDFRHSG